MKPNYVARKSAIGSGGIFWCILLSVLIIPIFILIWKIISARHQTIEFYDDKVISHKGVLSKSEKHATLTKITSVSVNQSIGGRIFNYGNVRIDVIGKFDIDLTGIINPNGLKRYLEHKIARSDELNQYVMD